LNDLRSRGRGAALRQGAGGRGTDSRAEHEGASTLDVVNLVKQNLPKFQSVLPPGVKVSYEFDQSPYVTRAIRGLGYEGLLGAVLTGLMVLLFLRDWRSALVVVLNIPLAIAAALLALGVCGQTVNLMTLGGLALAVGILVDEATVSIENIHTHLAAGQPLKRAALDATRETTMPRLLAMLSILAVFIPTFFMRGAAKSLFVPLALAVGFSMVASYLLSSTLVPILCVWLLRSRHGQGGAHRKSERRSTLDRLRGGYGRVSSGLVGLRWVLVPVYLLALSLFALGLSWFVSSVQVFLRDTAQVLSVVLTFWFWLTPFRSSPAFGSSCTTSATPPAGGTSSSASCRSASLMPSSSCRRPSTTSNAGPSTGSAYRSPSSEATRPD